MRVYVHGNCQASAIGLMLQEARPDWDIVSREVHTFDVADPGNIEAYQEQVSGADLILAQPISDDYRGVEFLSLSWIRANKGPGSMLRVFPSIYFRGYNPQSFDLHMDGHLMDYHDVHVADMFLAGIEPEECHERIASPSFFTQDFVLAEFFQSLRNLTQREQSTGVDARASSIILSEHNREPLFHTFNHPGRTVLRGVTEQLMRAAGHAVAIDPEGPSYLSNIRIMPYRSLAMHLGMANEALPEQGLMIRLGTVESLRNYVEAAHGCYRAAGPEALRERLAAYPQAGAYLKRFHQAEQRPSLDADQLVLGLFRELMGREPCGWEVEYWVKGLPGLGPEEVVRRFVGSAEYQDRLACRVRP
jgi:hypothetical protein